MNHKKGFTIIELIVVIAIIAVLAGIVLVNVQGYTNKGKVAAIKASMNSLRTTAVRYFENRGDFSNFCGDADFTRVTTAINNIQTPGYAECGSKNYPKSSYALTCSTTQWVYVSFLINFADGLWCVDNTGVAKFESGISGVSGCQCL